MAKIRVGSVLTQKDYDQIVDLWSSEGFRVGTLKTGTSAMLLVLSTGKIPCNKEQRYSDFVNVLTQDGLNAWVYKGFLTSVKL